MGRSAQYVRIKQNYTEIVIKFHLEVTIKMCKNESLRGTWVA